MEPEQIAVPYEKDYIAFLTCESVGGTDGLDDQPIHQRFGVWEFNRADW